MLTDDLPPYVFKAYYAELAISREAAAELSEAQRLVSRATWHDLREWDGGGGTLLGFAYGPADNIERSER
jgi:hypothetical protein